MIYRTLNISELNRELFADFIRHQVVNDCWRRENDAWVIKPDPFTDDWSEEDYQELLTHLREICLSGGFIYAAFWHGKLKGFVSVAPGRFGNKKEYMDLTNIHVSEDMRRKGIGKTLFLAAAAWARDQGAEKLYISAHSAVESQAFYHSMGCIEATQYQQGHVDKEPIDCQLELSIKKIPSSLLPTDGAYTP